MAIPPITYQICKTEEEVKGVSKGAAIIQAGLQDNFLKRLGHIEYERPLHIYAHYVQRTGARYEQRTDARYVQRTDSHDTEGRIAGGLIGRVFCGWLFVESLWVDEPLRGKGVGKKLLELAETQAVQMGCQYAHLETFTFEARPFYEKLDYEVFAVLEDYPPGQTKYFLKKKLVP
jgi:GNAT superfamily N-acetyltransferase